MYKQYFENRKVIIFDLDGTILDTTAYWELALIKVMSEVSIFEIFEGKGKGFYVGDKIQTLLNLNSNSIHGLSVSTLTGYANQEFLKLIDSDKELYPRDGFTSLALALNARGKSVVLCSNSDKHVVEHVLSKFNLTSFFDAIFTGDMVKNRKPNPDIYNLICKSLKVKPKECLVFEDSKVGIESARSAKMDAIAIWDPLSDESPREYPDNVIYYTTDFEEFPDNLDYTPKDLLDNMKKTYDENPEAFS